ncbi:MAG: amino acid ABC transporter permease [Bacilli bacterium]|jgi:His/Glu/Gln/Arg/opine family amino acid ABC transporter permease subunit|nr:amino acid ABC transporter permease [Bacilli bacterium]
MNLFIDILPSLLNGLKTTLLLFIVVLIISIPLGFIVALIRIHAHKIITTIIQFYIFIMRGTPLLLQIMFIFFGLPYLGITLNRIPAALIAFILNYTAYYAEIFRGGILAIPKNQSEAIKVLGIGQIRGFLKIIMPQVFKIVLPSVGNEVINLVKDTSLIYIIGITEILRAGQTAVNTYATPIPFIFVGIFYLIITAFITLILNKIEKKI